MTVVDRIRATGLLRSERARFHAEHPGSLSAGDIDRNSKVVADAVAELVAR